MATIETPVPASTASAPTVAASTATIAGLSSSDLVLTRAPSAGAGVAETPVAETSVAGTVRVGGLKAINPSPATAIEAPTVNTAPLVDHWVASRTAIAGPTMKVISVPIESRA